MLLFWFTVLLLVFIFGFVSIFWVLGDYMGGQATNELLGIEGKIQRGLGFTGKLKLCIYHIYI